MATKLQQLIFREDVLQVRIQGKGTDKEGPIISQVISSLFGWMDRRT